MEQVQYIEREPTNGPRVSQWQNSCTEQLGAWMGSSGCGVATTVLQMNSVDTARVHKCEVFNGIPRNCARVTVVTQKDLDAQGLERYILEMVSSPMLERQKEWSMDDTTEAENQVGGKRI